MIIVGTCVIVAIAIAVGLFVDRKVGLLPRPEKLAAPPPRIPSHAAGDAPATAIRAGDAQVAKLRVQRCRECRGELTAADDDHVRYDEHDLLVLHFGCNHCGAKRSLYVWLIALVALVSGCDYFVGLTKLGPRGPESDTASVTGTYVQRWIENASGGVPVPAQERGVQLGTTTATVRLDDGSPRDVTWTDDKTFTFTIETAGQAYSLDLHGPNGDTSYQLAVSEPALVDRYSGRIDRDPVVPGTILKLHVNNRPNGDVPIVKEEIQSTGIWSRTQITPQNEVSGQADYTLDWATVTNASGAMGLTAPHDSLWYAHYTTDNNSNVHLDTYKEIQDAALVSGGTVPPYTVTLPAPFSFQSCSTLKANITREVVRLDALASADIAAVYYAIDATPRGGEFAATASFPLVYATTINRPTDPDTVTTTTLHYIDPFWTTEHRVHVAVSALGSTGQLFATYMPRDDGINCSPTTTVIDTGVVAVATSASVGGITLDTPLKPVSFDPTSIVDIDWQPSIGAVDYWVVRLQQIIGGSTIDKLDIVTTDPHATFAANRLVPSKVYRIEIQAWVGYTDARAGDFTTFDPTSLAIGTLDSPTFQY